MRRALYGSITLLSIAWSTATLAQEPVVIRCPDVGTKFRVSPSNVTIEVIEDLGAGICRYRNAANGRDFTQFVEFNVKAKPIESNLEKIRSLSPLQVGKSVSFTYSGPATRGTDGAWTYTVAVEKFETVKVPAGDFPAYVILYDERGFGGGGRWQSRWWYSPVVRYPVQFEYLTLRGNPPPSYPKDWKLGEVKLR
jgi:hypothetical protein